MASGVCDNDWPGVVTPGSITWSTTPHNIDPFANAIQWSTLYNFWFEANVAPDTTTATIGLFKPGALASVSAETVGPALGIVDCNGNGVPDACDIDCTAPGCGPPCGGSSDCNNNGIPDEICEPDCNGNGIADECDIGIAYGGVCEGPNCSTDCQPNTVPDECEPDCNQDGVPDECAGFEDCDGDGIGDCDDACPCTTPVGSCVCPNDGCCFIESLAQCFEGLFTQESCEAGGHTWVCDRGACRDGCLLGDWDADGDVDLKDNAAFQNCFSGPLEDPGFVAPSTQCLATFDFDGDGDIDHADFKELEIILTDPIGVFTVCPGLCTQCTVDADCDDANACTNDSCQGSICIHDPIPDCVPCEASVSNSCDDANACTSDDTCVEGVCSGVQIPGCQSCSGPANCDDGDLCTTDECVASACVFTPIFNEATECCDPATGTVTVVDDGDPCTVDSCDPQTGLVSHTPGQDGTPCDDGLFCNGSDTCLAGTCSQHAGDPCLGGAECVDTCDEQSDSCNTPASTPCTGDGNVCTDNVCDGSGNCTAVNNTGSCDDGVFCNGTDTCSGGSCSMHAGDPCLGGPECAGTCNEAADTCNAPSGTLCTGDGNVCTDDACNGAGVCMATNNTSPCSDGDVCTINDTCDGNGFCVGTPSTEPSCIGMAEICLKAGRSSLGTEGCFAATEDVVVNIMLTQSPSVITGGQVKINFDPTKLRVISVTPGSEVDVTSPFSVEILEVVDNAAGTIFYVVGVAPGVAGTMGPAVLGSIRFQSLVTCANIGPLCFAEDLLPNTALTDDAGQKVPFTVCCSGDLRIHGDVLETSCPPDVTRNANAGTFNGLVTWDLSQAVSGCTGGAELVCTATHSTGINIDHLIQVGGLFPVGRAEFVCSTADGCGAGAACSWTVQINPSNSFEVMVQLSPTIVPGPLNRCIEFQFFSNCLEPPLVVEQELQFGLPFSLPGQAATVAFKVPAGKYACVTARDPLHSLRSVSGLEILDGHTFTARFGVDPFFGGNWLIGGNLNGDHVIDILDFGIFIVEQQSVMLADTICGTEGPHADINGDGIVDVLDLGFVLNNFLEIDKDSCCPGAAAGRAVPVREIAVEDLGRLGLEDLRVADLNGDGLINFEDIQHAMRGDVPAGTKPVRGSSRR